MKRVFESVFVEQCAPTLAGVKPASLFRFGAESIDTIRDHTVTWDNILRPLGLRAVVLKECPAAQAAMIYVYRVGWLKDILSDNKNLDFLKQIGYRNAPVPNLLQQLSERLCLEREYPHEIGIFLGYPLQDVIGFIENRGWNYSCCGCWKSYSDPEFAQKCFACYHTCTRIYKQMYERGTPIPRLIVAA